MWPQIQLLQLASALRSQSLHLPPQLPQCLLKEFMMAMKTRPFLQPLELLGQLLLQQGWTWSLLGLHLMSQLEPLWRCSHHHHHLQQLQASLHLWQLYLGVFLLPLHQFTFLQHPPHLRR
jgi:hypothetical protein